MTHYAAIITEETAPTKGQVIANTKKPGKYRGMTKEEFTEATKYISCYKITIKELQ